MVDALGGGLVDDPKTATPGAQGQVDVLLVGEVQRARPSSARQSSRRTANSAPLMLATSRPVAYSDRGRP